MASNTERLGLLKKDPVLDGADTFNLKTMLNDNWDKIDEKVAVLGPDGKIPVEQMGDTQTIILSPTAPENPTTNTWWYEDLGESVDLGGGGSGGLIIGNASLDGSNAIWFDNI